MSIIAVVYEKTPLISGVFSYTTQVYKPGSVLTVIYLVLQLLAKSSRLPGTVGSTYCSSTALLRIEFTAPQCSHEASALLPHFFTMTGKPATSLCCTCPGVTPGGRYPLSLPFGARTFLTRIPLGIRPRLSNLVACLFYSKKASLSNILKNESILCILIFVIWG